ncbi:MAG: glutaredoxin family protein [Candidatus Diapherotrites archaeon]|uniref:Glutaredoxin family protein n=1 Tax=Candidatus Iainarchaeum sp. TaxID=3101447 RepID=A0A8T3YIR7_9ARCH|nr:glutaredoxin family protein [Candidatus Diapherotrites archaeon]
MASVTIYSTPSCVYCRMAKKFFEENNVKYTEYNVADDYEKAEEMIKKSGQQGVPVIDIDGKVIVGFDKAAIKEALKIS